MFCTKLFDSKILVRHRRFGDPIADRGKQLRSETPIKSIRWLLTEKFSAKNYSRDGSNRTINFQSALTGSGPETTSLKFLRPSTSSIKFS